MVPQKLLYGAAMTEVLAQEVAPFGSKVLLIEAGPFETKFYSPSNVKQVKALIPKMLGDLECAAKIIIVVSQLPEMPKLLFLRKPCISYAE